MHLLLMKYIFALTCQFKAVSVRLKATAAWFFSIVIGLVIKAAIERLSKPIEIERERIGVEPYFEFKMNYETAFTT